MKYKASLSRVAIILITLVLLLILINRLYAWGWALEVLGGVLTKQILPLLLVAAALGTDAMSLSIGIGLRGVSWREVVRVSLVIGLFHVLMPLVGTAGGHFFGMFAKGVAHWVGAGIVAYIGIRMIWNCFQKEQSLTANWTLSGLPLLMLALSVSIDALSVGFSLGTFGYSIYVTSFIFGLFGAAMTAIGLLFGSSLGKLFGGQSELIGGGVLIFLALHMFFEG